MFFVTMLSLILTSNATEDMYSSASDGQFLYKVDFSGRDGIYKPGLLNGTINTELDIDPGKITLTVPAERGKKKNSWGGEISGLPLNEGTAYTVYYTISRQTDGSLGIFIDSNYGPYGYSHRQRFSNGGGSLSPHQYIVYADNGIKAEGDVFNGATTLDIPSSQRYALEINGQKKTLKLYVMETNGDWALVDESSEGEIGSFYTYNLHIVFYQYYADMPVTVSDVSIFKGMTVSGEKLAETTPAPDTTKAPETSAPETSTPETSGIGDSTPGNDEVSSAAPQTQPENTEGEQGEDTEADSGCGAVIATSGWIISLLLLGSAWLIYKKH